MNVQYIDLADYLAIAVEVTGLDAHALTYNHGLAIYPHHFAPGFEKSRSRV